MILSRAQTNYFASRCAMAFVLWSMVIAQVACVFYVSWSWPALVLIGTAWFTALGAVVATAKVACLCAAFFGR